MASKDPPPACAGSAAAADGGVVETTADGAGEDTGTPWCAFSSRRLQPTISASTQSVAIRAWQRPVAVAALDCVTGESPRARAGHARPSRCQPLQQHGHVAGEQRMLRVSEGAVGIGLVDLLADALEAIAGGDGSTVCQVIRRGGNVIRD